MIDLSFLTEEEQHSILAVLKRDAELKKAEEQRVRNLQKNVADKSQLKYLTGEWFYETKQLRHQDRIHGSDIIMASMRHPHKPLTILELCQVLPEKSSFESSENKEVFIPPVLRGLLQEPPSQPSNERYQNQNLHEMPQEPPKPLSPTKRKNPFNSGLAASYTAEENHSKVLDRAMDQTQSIYKEPLPSSDSCFSHASNLRQDHNDSLAIQNPPAPMPMPENKDITISSQGCYVELDWSGGRQTNSAAPRGILKHLSTSSSTDCTFSHLDLQIPLSLDSLTESWLDRKQVRFSSTLSQSTEEWQDGKELGEHSLLDTDSITPSETENNFLNIGNTTAGTCNNLLGQTQTDSQEGELRNEAHLQEQDSGQHQVFGDFPEHCYSELLCPTVFSLVSVGESGKLVHLETEAEEEGHCQAEATDGPGGHSSQRKMITESAGSSSARLSYAVSTQHRQKLLNMFSSEWDKNAAVQSKPTEELNIKQEKTGNTLGLYQGTVDTTVDTPVSVKHGAKFSGVAGVKTTQLATLRNTAFKETVTTEEAGTQQEATEDGVVQFVEKPSSLKAFWERENTGPNMMFTREEARQENLAKAPTETSRSPQIYTESTSNLSAQNEMTVTNGCSHSVDLLKEDLTYRANPIFIYEETDESLTGSGTESQISESHENICIPLPSSSVPVSLPSQSTSSPQGAIPSKISDLRHFWEKEYTQGPRAIIARVSEASNTSVPGNKEVPPQCDLKRYWDNREKSNGEEQVSSYRTKPNDVLQLLKVTDKVHCNPDMAQLTSSRSSENVNLTCTQVKSKAESKEGPLSPSLCHTTRSKDQNEEVRRSPSKTCHPRVLPTEPSSPKRSRLEGSPLKTFSIDINPETKGSEEKQRKPALMPRQWSSPSHELKQTALTATKLFTEVNSHLLPLHSEDTASYVGNPKPVNIQQSTSNSSTITSQSKTFTEEKLGTFTELTRSFMPQNYQHYLSPQEKTHYPPFQQEKTAAVETDAVQRLQSALREIVGNKGNSSNEWSCPRVSSHFVQSELSDSSRDTTTKARSLSRTSSDSYDGSSGPILSAQKLLSSRSISSSKSLENLTSQTISSCSPPPVALFKSKQMNTSLSVPDLQQDGIEIDLTEDNVDWKRNTSSTMSNLSLSSGMASISSVSGSISSIYPADCGDIEVQGSIQFAVNYIQKLGEFHIFVVHCRDLAVADTKRNRSDPYVKCYLLPDKTKLGKRKTIIKKKTLNPTYNEILRFSINIEVLKTQNLNISVWHNDNFGRNSFLGKVDLDLSEWDFSNTEINEYTLKNKVSMQTLRLSPSHVTDLKGQMRVALRFLPQMSHSNRTSKMETGEMQIWVKDCKNLPSVRGVTVDPFVKCTVLPDTSKKSRQKTRVVKRTANPMFNHTMVYNGFRPEDLREVCVELTVWDHDRLNNHYIGGVRLGLGTGKSYSVDVVWMDSTTDEAHLWQKMLQSDGEWVEDLLPLRMFVMAKSISK